MDGAGPEQLLSRSGAGLDFKWYLNMTSGEFVQVGLNVCPAMNRHPIEDPPHLVACASCIGPRLCKLHLQKMDENI